MPWLIRNPVRYVERASPSTMKQRYPAETFVDGNGKAVSTDFAIWNPDLSAVEGFASKYWLVADAPDETVTLMDQAARDAVDAAETEALLDEIADRIGDNRDLVRALGLVTLDAVNMLGNRTNAILDAFDNNSSAADIKAAVALINDVPDFDAADLRDKVRAKLNGGS